MPELPEVETVRRGLEVGLVGYEIVGVDVQVPKILRPPFNTPEAFSGALISRIVETVARRGKYLILGLDNGYSLAAHLKMRGQMRVDYPHLFTDERYLCVRMRLDDGREWRFYDMWTWGELRLLPFEPAQVLEHIPALARMGPEPLSADFTPDTFRNAARRSARRTVKALLLDQDVVAGLGNIYVDESLYRAGIDPRRRVGDISSEEWHKLHDEVRAVIGAAVEGGGTISDNFVNVGGSAGAYVPSVYGRHGEACARCEQILQRTIITGRGTVFCAGCQPPSGAQI